MYRMITSDRINTFFNEQLAKWELARKNYDSWKNIRTKEYDFGNFKMLVQFNPARAHSTQAKTDKEFIEKRKCFLCPRNLPLEQFGIPFGTDYHILVNPYPIFSRHFTIPTYGHIDQVIAGRYGSMLELARSMDEFTIFYNGPKSGASAPDHHHFQAGVQGCLPLEYEIPDMEKQVIYKDSDKLIAYELKNCLRSVIFVEAVSKITAVNFFRHLYFSLEVKEGDLEPGLNILTWYKEKKWHSCIFLREKHRPDCFFSKEEKALKASPGAVDLGGIFILGRQEDFDRIRQEDVKNILEEVSLSKEKMENLISLLKEKQA